MTLSYFRTCSTITGCRADDSKDTKIRKRSNFIWIGRGDRRIVYRKTKKKKKESRILFYYIIYAIYNPLSNYRLPFLIGIKVCIEHKYNCDKYDYWPIDELVNQKYIKSSNDTFHIFARWPRSNFRPWARYYPPGSHDRSLRQMRPCS